LPKAVLVAMAADIKTALSEAQAPQQVIAEVKSPEETVEAPVVLAGMAFTKIPVLRPEKRTTKLAELPAVIIDDTQPEVVTRISTSGGRHWGINIGSYGSRYEAERILLKTALNELGTLDNALRKVVQGKLGYEANFVGMTEDLAAMACRRLQARSVECNTLGPS
jgi:D-alanyl-D-alanine carboxypeptidase